MVPAWEPVDRGGGWGSIEEVDGGRKWETWKPVAAYSCILDPVFIISEPYSKIEHRMQYSTISYVACVCVYEGWIEIAQLRLLVLLLIVFYPKFQNQILSYKKFICV